MDDSIVDTFVLAFDLILAGATGLEPAASCVTGRRFNLGEAGCTNVTENYRAKRCALRGNSGCLIGSLLAVGDRAAF